MAIACSLLGGPAGDLVDERSPASAVERGSIATDRTLNSNDCRRQTLVSSEISGPGRNRC